MKKIFLILLFFTCGCGNKLICTYKESLDDIEINNKLEFDFKNKKYSQIDTMIFLDSTTAKKYYNEIQEYSDEYNLVLNENKIVSKLNYEIKKNTTKKELKNKYENYGYKCN